MILTIGAYLLAAHRLNADTVVAPDNLANEEGLAAVQAFTGAHREQTIYSAADFIVAMPQGGIITQIAYRLDGQFASSVDAVVPPLVISISTTASPPQNFPFEWSKNSGSDVRVVYSGSLAIQSDRQAQRPNPFLVTVPLRDPFPYDPRNGNLLIDVSLSRGATRPVILDGEGLERHVGTHNDAADSTDNGFILQLTFSPIPEPVPVEICSLGALALLGRRK